MKILDYGTGNDQVITCKNWGATFKLYLNWVLKCFSMVVFQNANAPSSCKACWNLLKAFQKPSVSNPRRSIHETKISKLPDSSRIVNFFSFFSSNSSAIINISAVIKMTCCFSFSGSYVSSSPSERKQILILLQGGCIPFLLHYTLIFDSSESVFLVPWAAKFATNKMHLLSFHFPKQSFFCKNQSENRSRYIYALPLYWSSNQISKPYFTFNERGRCSQAIILIGIFSVFNALQYANAVNLESLLNPVITVFDKVHSWDC